MVKHIFKGTFEKNGNSRLQTVSLKALSDQDELNIHVFVNFNSLFSFVVSLVHFLLI